MREKTCCQNVAGDNAAESLVTLNYMSPYPANHADTA